MSKFKKGDRVEILDGLPNFTGGEGEVFWVGVSRYSDGRRYGVRLDNGETVWADDGELIAVLLPVLGGALSPLGLTAVALGAATARKRKRGHR